MLTMHPDERRRVVRLLGGLTLIGHVRGGGLRRATLEWQPSAHDLSEDDRVVMFRISSGEHERERAVAGPPPELRETRTLPAKLICVAPTELLEATRIVSEPRPQLGARRQLRFPCVQRCSLPRHPSRPEAVDQDSVPVRTVRWLVHALQSDIHCMPPYAPLVRLQMAQTGRTRAGWSWPHNALLEFATKPTATPSLRQLLRYRDERSDDWADIIDMLTMHPGSRRKVVAAARGDRGGRQWV